MTGLKPGFGRLATLGEVFDLLYSHLPHLGDETAEISEALHRVLAEDVVSAIDVPHFAKSGMDGYAVIASETYGATDGDPKVLEVIGSVWPGQIPDREVSPGTCFEIGTGALLPGGADAVVMVEYTEAEESRVRVRKVVAPRENLVEPGSDVAAGTKILVAGTLLEPRHLGVLAAVGRTYVEVVRRPRVALFSTGPEIVPAGETLRPGRIYDINSYTLRAALQSDGCDVIDMGIVDDDPKALDLAIAAAVGEGDLVLLSGGSSLGGGDLVVEAFRNAGKMILHGVAVKPGKPAVFGLARSKDARGADVEKVLIGLPGYPTSALSDYYIFVQPFLRRALGMTARPTVVEASLSRKHPSTVGRYEFLAVRLEGDEAVPLTKGSSAITTLADADGFVEIDENIEVIEKGQPVRVRLF